MKLKYKWTLLKREIRFAYQRLTRGYDDKLYYDMHSYMTHLFIAGLTQMIERPFGYPGSLNGEEEWKDIMREIREGFLMSEQMDAGDIEWSVEKDNELVSKLERSFELLSEWYLALWT